MFEKLKIHKYFDLPDCPKCGSKRTGAYVYSPTNFSSLGLAREKENLKNGQLIRTTSVPLQDLGYNLFCDDCGVDWRGQYKIIYLSKEELKKKIEEKEIDLEAVKETYKIDKKLRKKNKKVTKFVKNYIIPDAITKPIDAISDKLSSKEKEEDKEEEDSEPTGYVYGSFDDSDDDYDDEE